MPAKREIPARPTDARSATWALRPGQRRSSIGAASKLRGLSEERTRRSARPASVWRVPARCSGRSLVALLLGAEAEVVEGHADEAADHRQVAEPLQGALPQAHGERHARILGEPAIGFGIGDVVEHVDDAGAADALGIVDTRIGMRGVLAQLRSAR